MVVASGITELVEQLNGLPRAKGGGFCDDAEGLMVRIVFWYPDASTLPILLDGETCGWADNGTPERVDATELANITIPSRYDSATTQ